MNSPLVEETLDEIENTLKFLSTDFEFESTPRTATPADDDDLESPMTMGAQEAPIRPLYDYRTSPRESCKCSSACSPWPLCNGEDMAYFNSTVEPSQRRPSVKPERPAVPNSNSFSRRRRMSSSASYGSGPSYVPSPFPAPSKPLPALPPPSRSSTRLSSHRSTSDLDSFADWKHLSHSSGTTTTEPSRSSLQSIITNPVTPGADVTERPSTACTSPEASSPKSATPDGPDSDLVTVPETSSLELESSDPADRLNLELTYRRRFQVEKPKGNNVCYIDASGAGSTVATKHGKNLLRFWSAESGNLTGALKFSVYPDTSNRPREGLVRSHAILSESVKMAAVATRFGRTIEIWDWAKNKKLQTINDADRWTASRFESFDVGWSPLAAYKGETGQIDLYAAAKRDKKPFAKVRSIDLKRAGLPSIMQYPELALSPTSPLLVAAAGPRTPKLGRPAPDRETVLAIWQIHDQEEVSSEPYRVLKPWQYRELNTAMPHSLYTYGSLVVSTWIPASSRVELRASALAGLEHKMIPVNVAFRYILVWDMSDGSSSTYPIPNTTSCISPDCRFVAYCQIAERRTKLAILEATTGNELWCVGGEGNLKSAEAFGDLSKVTELAFSPDGKLLFLGDADGNTGVYDVREIMKQ